MKCSKKWTSTTTWGKKHHWCSGLPKGHLGPCICEFCGAKEGSK